MKQNFEPEKELRELSYDAVQEVTGDLELDKDTKQRILEKTFQKVGVASQSETVKACSVKRGVSMRNKMNFKKPAVAAAAVVLACSVGVGSMAAAGALHKTFGQYFHSLSESHYEDLLFDVNQTASDKGVTVTVTQAMCDGNALYVIEKVEFDPSVLVLTDEMFRINEYGGYTDAPCWAYDQLINVKETDADPNKDIGGVSERLSTFRRLLEHDAHSVTWLRVYGGGDHLSSRVDQFFTNGSQFILRYSGMDNFPGRDLTEPYDCHMEIAFHMGKVSKPNCYTLPEEVYGFTQAADEDVADMVINPWYMNFSGAAGTGKVLDTSLRTIDVPEIEVTMKGGTSYTEKNGISMPGDYFGRDYSKFDHFHCYFDTPVDIQNIRSIKVYGYEMKPGKVAADKSKEKAYENTDGFRILPATSPATFPDEWKKVWYRTEIETYGVPSISSDYGHFQYRVKGVKVYDNLYATGPKDRVYHDDYSIEFGYDEETGQLAKDCYLLEYAIELHNIDANFTESLSTFDWEDTGYFENLFYLELYNGKQPYNNYCPEVYIRENEYDVTEQICSIKLDKGETKTFHVSFLVKDNHAGGLEQVGLCVCSDRDEGKMTYTNLRKVIEEFNQNASKK